MILGATLESFFLQRHVFHKQRMVKKNSITRTFFSQLEVSFYLSDKFVDRFAPLNTRQDDAVECGKLRTALLRSGYHLATSLNATLRFGWHTVVPNFQSNSQVLLKTRNGSRI